MQAFVLKLAASGTEIAYGALFIGAEGKGIAVDGTGAAYVVGRVESPGLPTTPGSVKPASQPNGDRINEDGFLLKINPAGTSLEFGTYLGGTGRDRALAVAVDSSGIAAVAGSTDSESPATTRAGGSLRAQRNRVIFLRARASFRSSC